ncbi:MAG: PmoA family protein [Acidobacteria bacterium]|nr:PmoA family protein [Acidobacteriota bacterium]
MSPGEFLDADGRGDVDEIFGSTSRWCGFSGRHSEDGQVYGITVIDHPKNPRHPTTWWIRNRKDFCLLQPSPSYHEPFELSPGEPLTLQYRIVLHRGPVSPDIIEEAAW